MIKKEKEEILKTLILEKLFQKKINSHNQLKTKNKKYY